MKRLLAIVTFAAFPYLGEAQALLSPQQRTVLDFYYAKALTNSIDGSWIIDGTITTNKLSTNLQSIISSSVTNVVFVPSDSNFAYSVGNDLFLFQNTNEADKVKYNIFTESNKFTDIELDGSITSVDEIQWDITFTNGSAEGKMQWNVEDGTLEVGLPGGNVNLQIGQEQVIRARNTTGSTITNGRAVAIVGAQGNRPLIALADADALYPTNIISGVATEDIADNSNGYITTEGLVRDYINSFTVGDRLYLSTTPGELTNIEPPYPTDAHEAGVVVTTGANGILHVHISEHKHWETLDGEYRPLYNCLPKKGNRPILDWAVSAGGVVTAIVDVVEADNELSMIFDEEEYNFATPVYLEIANGATNLQQFSYIYVTTNGITNSTTFPSGEYAMLFDLSVLDAARTAVDGLFTLRRWTDNASGPAVGDDRSLLQRATERIRSMPATWISGGTLDAIVTTVGGGDDDVYITSAAGTSYQFNPQSFSAVTATNGTVEYHLYNDPDSTFLHITNLNQITQDSSGNAVLNTANSYFNVSVMRHFPSGTTNSIDSSLILKLSSSDYSDEDRALADSDGLLDFSVPSRMAGEVLVLGFVTLNRSAAGGGTWTAQVTSQLGREVGTSGGGSSTLPSANSFIDTSFRVIDDADPTKEISFEADQISTATTREYTWPDKDGTVAMLDDISGSTTYSFFATKTSAQSLTATTQTKVTITNEIFDIGDGYDAPNSKYVPPVNGKYYFHYHSWCSTEMGLNRIAETSLYTNGVRAIKQHERTYTDIYLGCDVSAVFHLTTNDYVEAYQYYATSSESVGAFGGTYGDTYFEGFYIGE